MKKTRLIVDYDYEFELLGIISSVKFYKLAWAINNNLKVHLVKERDYEIVLKDNVKVVFGSYVYGEEGNKFQLMKNKSEGNERAHLIPEMSHLDYIIRLESQSQTFAAQELLPTLREVKWIEYIASIEVDKLKSKDNFLS